MIMAITTTSRIDSYSEQLRHTVTLYASQWNELSDICKTFSYGIKFY